MKVNLLHTSPWDLVMMAARTCYDSLAASDFMGEKDVNLLKRLAKAKPKHKSVFEHKTFTFELVGYSRSVLQELSRHRHQSLSVQSTRYTLKKLKDCETAGDYCRFLVPDDEGFIWPKEIEMLQEIKKALLDGYSNDLVKRRIPESFSVKSVNTFNFSSLMNLLELRDSDLAYPEFRKLVQNIRDVIYKQDELTRVIVEAWENNE